MFKWAATLFVDLATTTSKCCSYVSHIIVPILLSCNLGSPHFSNKYTLIRTLGIKLEGESTVLTRGKMPTGSWDLFLLIAKWVSLWWFLLPHVVYLAHGSEIWHNKHFNMYLDLDASSDFVSTSSAHMQMYILRFSGICLWILEFTAYFQSSTVCLKIRIYQ